MHKIKVTSNIRNLSNRLSLWRKNDLFNVEIILEFSISFITPAILVMITSWALEMKLRQITFLVKGNSDTLLYLDRMGFHRAIGAPSLHVQQYPEAGRFMPLSLLTDTRKQTIAVDNICELILKQFDNARTLLPAFEWAVNEITDNVFTHAQSPTPCVIAAQYYPVTKVLEIAIADQGLGFLGTLGPIYDAISDYQAIELALTRGLTRDTNIGQGNGLAGTELIVEENMGELFIWTGTTNMAKTNERVYSKFYNSNGVGIVLRLRVDNPVDLGSIWIGERPYTYIDSCIQTIESGSALSVLNECNSVGSREPARRLRNKLLTLLPDIEEKIVLDFSKCGSPSSSFFDELFGRLILNIGIDNYKQKIKIIGLDEMDYNVANVVIHQRLELHEN